MNKIQHKQVNNAGEVKTNYWKYVLAALLLGLMAAIGAITAGTVYAGSGTMYLDSDIGQTKYVNCDPLEVSITGWDQDQLYITVPVVDFAKEYVVISAKADSENNLIDFNNFADIANIPGAIYRRHTNIHESVQARLSVEDIFPESVEGYAEGIYNVTVTAITDDGFFVPPGNTVQVYYNPVFEMVLDGSDLTWYDMPESGDLEAGYDAQFGYYTENEFHVLLEANAVNLWKTYDLAGLLTEEGTYLFEIRLWGHIPYVNMRVTFAVEAVRLPTPEVRIDGTIIYWDEIEHANGYRVYYGKEFWQFVETSETSYDLALFTFPEGLYDIYVCAIGNNASVLSSPESVSLLYRVAATEPEPEPEPEPNKTNGNAFSRHFYAFWGYYAGGAALLFAGLSIGGWIARKG